MNRRDAMRAVAAVKPTVLDRVVAYFLPAAGVARHAARVQMALAGGYTGGKRNRRQTQDWRPDGGSANADTLPELAELRARARDLSRNMPIATGAIATNVTEVVGDGLVPQAKIDWRALGLSKEEGRALCRKAEAEWQLFAATIDFHRIQSAAELQATILRGKLDSGDIFGIRRFRLDSGDTYGTKLQLLEADRVCNPNHRADQADLAGGIQFDGSGVPIAVHATNRHPGDERVVKLEWTAIPIFDQGGRRIVEHWYEQLRPEQARGIPYLAPVVEALRELGAYTEAEARAAVVSALFTVFVKHPAGEDGPSLGETDGSTPGNEMKLGNGAIIDLADGEEIDTANPGRPNSAFDPFVMAVLRQVGVALELPFEMLIKHFTASYTASKAAYGLAWQYFRKVRSWMAARPCQVMWTWMWEEAVARGRIDAPGFFTDPARRQAYLWADWVGRPAVSLDPVKDAEAAQIDMLHGVRTLQQVTQEKTGADWEDNQEQRAAEVEMRRKLKLEAETPAAPAGGTAGGQRPPGNPGSDREDSAK